MARHRWPRDDALFGQAHELTLGAQFRTDAIENGLDRTVARRRLSTTRADDILQTSGGLYWQDRTQWLEKFRTVAGVRGDAFRFDVDSDHPANSGERSDFMASPKLSLIFGPWARTEYYVSGGMGYHSNDGRGVNTTIDPGSGAAVSRADPLVRSEGTEVGVRTLIVPNLHSTLALWLLDLDSELLFVGDAGTTEASRPSRRYGVEFANYYTPKPWLTLDADFSWSHARFTDSDPAGDHIPGAVEGVIAAGISVHELKGWYAGLRIRFFGPRALVEDDSVRSSSSTLLYAHLGYEFNDRWAIGVPVFNLLDSQVDDIAYYYTSRLPGEPRTFRVVARAKF
jgi:hypothetical protein